MKLKDFFPTDIQGQNFQGPSDVHWHIQQPHNQNLTTLYHHISYDLTNLSRTPNSIVSIGGSAKFVLFPEVYLVVLSLCLR